MLEMLKLSEKLLIYMSSQSEWTSIGTNTANMFLYCILCIDTPHVDSAVFPSSTEDILAIKGAHQISYLQVVDGFMLTHSIV